MTIITKTAGGDLDGTNRAGADYSTLNSISDFSEMTFVLRAGGFKDAAIFQPKFIVEPEGSDLNGLIIAVDNSTAAQISKIKTSLQLNAISDPPTLTEEDRYGFTTEFLVTMADNTLKKFKIFLPYHSQTENQLDAWDSYVKNTLVGDGVALVSGNAWGDGHCQLYFTGMKRHATQKVVKVLKTRISRMG